MTVSIEIFPEPSPGNPDDHGLRVNWGNDSNEVEEGNVTHALAVVILDWLEVLIRGVQTVNLEDEQNVNEGCVSVG